MEIKDPCKAGKCIAYPICFNKDMIDCPILLKHLQDNYQFINKNGVKYVSTASNSSWRYIETFLPNLSTCVNLSHVLLTQTEKDRNESM